jgi:hypothetical protein
LERKQRPKEEMSGYAKSAVIDPLMGLKPQSFVASKRYPLCADTVEKVEKLSGSKILANISS